MYLGLTLLLGDVIDMRIGATWPHPQHNLEVYASGVGITTDSFADLRMSPTPMHGGYLYATDVLLETSDGCNREIGRLSRGVGGGGSGGGLFNQ